MSAERKKKKLWGAFQTAGGMAVPAAKASYNTGVARVANRAKTMARLKEYGTSIQNQLAREGSAWRNARTALANARSAETAAKQQVAAAGQKAKQAFGKSIVARAQERTAKKAVAAATRRATSEAMKSLGSAKGTAISQAISKYSPVRSIPGNTSGVTAAKTAASSARGTAMGANRGFVGSVSEMQAAKAGLAKASSAARAAEAAMRAEEAAASASFQKTAQAALKAAPDATGFQKFLIGAKDRIGSAATGRTSAAVKKAVAGINPFASKAQIAANLANEGRLGKTVLGAGRVGAKAVGGVAKTLALPAKAISGTFNAAGRISNAVLGTSKAANLLRGMTSASGLAGGFALGAWTDAGLKAYDFFSNGGKMSDLYSSKTEQINGHTVATVPSALKNSEFYKTYGKEVLKGLQSALTLGFTGNGEDTWLDRKFDSEPEEGMQYRNGVATSAPRSAKEGLVDVNGEAVYSQAEIDKENAMLQADFLRRQEVQKFAQATRGSLAAQNVRSMADQLAATREAALAKVAENVKNFESYSRENAKVLRGMTAEQYEKSATASADRDYNARMGMLLSNKASAEVMNQNRAAAYLMLTGRVYDDDSKNTLSESLTNDFKEFNKKWYGEYSDAQRLTWNQEAERKRYESEIADEEKIRAANTEGM